VLQADGRRLVALARYGLADHTPSQRRGGLELIGVVAPPSLDVYSALAIYHWLRQRRDAVDDLHQLGGCFSLSEIVANVEPPPPHADPIPVLPVRLWQEGALLFAASTPSDPDHRLRLLEQGAGASWQWLPLVGPDFPLQTYAQRGPLIAWTPHLAGIALKLDRKTTETPAVQPARSSRGLRSALLVLTLLLLGLLAANLWSTLALHRNRTESPPAGTSVPENVSTSPSLMKQPTSAEDTSRERFVAVLHGLLMEEGGREWNAEKSRLLIRYERLVRAHKDLQVRDGDTEGKITVAAISVLAARGTDRIEAEVRKALANKGFSDKLIKAACEHVREQFAAELQER
jgi:hypothetical protein